MRLYLKLAVFLLVFVLFASSASYALPPWLQRGGAEEERRDEVLKMPDFDYEQEEEIRPYHAPPQRTKGPFLWIFSAFIAAAFITSL